MFFQVKAEDHLQLHRLLEQCLSTSEMQSLNKSVQVFMKKKKKLTESNAHRPSFCCVHIKRHVWNIAAALKLGVYGRKGSCQSPKHGCHVGTLSQDSTLWQGSNKYCLPIPAYSATPKDTPAPTAIHTGKGQEFQLQEFVSSQSVLLHGHQQCTLALYAQHHDAITDAIGTMNLS